MNYRKKTLHASSRRALLPVLFFLLISLLSCRATSAVDVPLYKNHLADVDAVIEEYPVSIVYFMTNWCRASAFGLNEGLIPFSKAHPEVPVIIVLVGNRFSDAMIDSVTTNFSYVYQSKTLVDIALAHKIRISRLLKAFEDSNYDFSVPVTLFTNQKKKKLYSSVGMQEKIIIETLESLRENIKDEG